MKSISILGVVVGGITDIVATNVFAVPVILAAAVAGNITRLPQAQQSTATLAYLHAHPAFFLTSFFVGAACSVLGGFIAALIAKRSEVLNGALSSFLCIGFAIYGIWKGTTGEPLWLTIALMPLSPALGALGGHLQHLNRTRRMNTAFGG